MYKFFFLILLTAIFLLNSFGFGPNIYPLRLVLPFSALVVGLLFFQKVIIEQKKVTLSPLLLVTGLFFAYMFLHTFLVTGYRAFFLDVNYATADVLNYALLAVLVMTIFFYALLDRAKMLRFSYGVVRFFYVSYALFAVYEIATGNHLPSSNLYDAPSWMRYVPTAVYFNSNDFAAIFTLMFLFLFTDFQSSRKLYARLGMAACIILHIFILYKSQSRLSFLLFGGFLLYQYPKRLSALLFLSFLLFFFIGWFGETSWYMQTLDSLAKLKQDLSFEERNSTVVRLYLYKHALLSVVPSSGMGFGINASANYYQSIMDPNLFHITNPHSYIFELLINSGVVVTLFYLFLNGYLMVKNWMLHNYNLVIQLIIYNLLLFSSSSSLFLWPIYLFFLIYIVATVEHEEKEIKN